METILFKTHKRQNHKKQAYCETEEIGSTTSIQVASGDVVAFPLLNIIKIRERFLSLEKYEGKCLELKEN